VFDVRQVSGQPYLARAFFPSNARSSRSVLIDTSAFGNVGWPLANILGHELGQPYAGVPSRAHASRSRHVLREQQLAPAHSVRLGVEHALRVVQRYVAEPRLDGARRGGCRRAEFGVRWRRGFTAGTYNLNLAWGEP
jgi:hypothetical protein